MPTAGPPSAAPSVTSLPTEPALTGTILFSRTGAIVVMSADGSDPHEVVPAASHAEVANRSPDGSEIGYGVPDLGATIVPVAAGGLKRPGTVGDPSFSPDGELVVGTPFRASLHAVVITAVRPDAQGLRVIWSPEPNKDIVPQTPTWILP